MAVAWDFSEEDVTLAQMKEYLRSMQVEHGGVERFDAFAQWCLDVTETE